MKAHAIAYPITGATMLGLDAVWLTLTASRLYRPLLGDLLSPHTSLAPAVLFYLIYVVGVTVFAVRPGQGDGTAVRAAARGALLGLVAYATYDLTNQATLRDWPVLITIVDLAWGSLLTATAAAVGAAATGIILARR